MKVSLSANGERVDPGRRSELFQAIDFSCKITDTGCQGEHLDPGWRSELHQAIEFGSPKSDSRSQESKFRAGISIGEITRRN
ncbi:Hypothetical predicted protein [Olea europaea subsp. europaea]|uniref:Uncharacterized protein n=1 Tax=Olea europaea subsp. europaea TaxID=158383 RepID=A0A8S0PCD3_OLEEU|nr:Hypothetical predicted protein [Olea europaea subsp. europaea]